MKRILLTGLSLTAVTIGLSVASASASAETATGVYGVVDTTAVDTDASDKSYIFSADGDLKVQDGHNIGAGIAGTTAQDYEMKTDGAGAWTDGTGTALDRDISAGQAIVTTTDGEGTLTFENTAGPITVTGSVGESDKALKAIVGSAGGALFKSDVFTNDLTVDGGDVSVDGMLSGNAGAGTTVGFDTDHALTVGGNATLGTVTGATATGVLNLGGQTNTITAIATGLKELNLTGPSASTTTISGSVTGLGLANIGAGTSLILEGTTAAIASTTLDNDSVFNIGDTAVTGDITANADGIGAVIIGKGTGGQTVTSVTGDIGTTAAAVGSVNYRGGAADAHTVTGATFAKSVMIEGTGELVLDGGLSSSNSAGTNVGFAADGTLTMGAASTLGAVTVATDNTGTIHLNTTAAAHTADSIGAAGASLKNLTITTASADSSLTVAGDSWINDLVLDDDATSHANAIFTGNANLGKVSVTTTDLNGLTLNGANNVVGEIGTAGTNLGTLTLGAGTTWVTGTDTAGAISGGANVDSVALAHGATALNLGAGTTNVFANGIGTDIDTAALKSLSLGAGSITTAAAGGVFSQNTVLRSNDKAGGNSVLTVDQAASHLGALTFGLGFDTETTGGGATFNLGQVDATGQILSVSGVNVLASNAATEGLSKAWSLRGTDTAVLTGSALKFNSLTLADGTTTVDFNGAQLDAGGNTYDTAGNLVVNDNLAMWNFALGQTGGANADLLAVQDAGGFRSNVASGANMNNFGGVVDGMISVVNDVNADPALQQFISGLTTGQASTVAQQMADMSVNNSVVGAVRGASMAASNAITANIGGGTGTSVASNSVASGINAGDTAKRNNAWLQVIGSWNDQSRRKGVDGYTADTYGFALGADTLVAEKTRLGLALHYANTNVDGKGVFSNNSSEINTYGVTLYGQQGLTDALFLDGRLGYAYNDVSADRRVNGLGGKADGSYGAHQFDVAAKLGYNAKVASNATLTPHVGLGYTYLGEDSYTESGNAARLNVGSRDTSALLIGAGVRGAVEFTTSDKTKIIPELRLGASYDALASDFNTTARFVGGGTAFTTRNVKPDPWTFNVGAGVNVATTGNFTVSANYDAALSSNFTGHTGSLRGKLAF